jgi:hypothetical protein
MVNSLLEKLCTIEKRLQTLTTAAESSAFVAHASTTKSQSLAIKTTSDKPNGLKKSTKDREKCSCFCCGKVGHLKMNCQKMKADTNKSVATDSMGSLSVDDTRISAFLAVRVNSMKLMDKWACDSGALHHMTVNKQYIAA